MRKKQNARHLQILHEQIVLLAICIQRWHDLGMRVALSLCIENELCGFPFSIVNLQIDRRSCVTTHSGLKWCKTAEFVQTVCCRELGLANLEELHTHMGLAFGVSSKKDYWTVSQVGMCVCVMRYAR